MYTTPPGPNPTTRVRGGKVARRTRRPAVEKNLTSVFNKLGIEDDAQHVNRRVSAAMIYLANNQGADAEGNPALR